MNSIIGFDFSIAKTGACVLSNNNYNFYLWPKDFKEKDINLLSSFNINIIPRNNIEIKDLVRYDILNASILADLIIFTLKKFINKNTLIIFEGASFSSKGNMTISLISWKYILIYKLSQLVPLENIFTYYPITVKSTARCAAKDKRGKNSMIEAFSKENINHEFNSVLKKTPNLLKKKINFIPGIDDLVDAYFVLKTHLIKMNL